MLLCCASDDSTSASSLQEMLKPVPCYCYVFVDIGLTVMFIPCQINWSSLGGKLIAVTQKEVGKVNSALHLKSTRGAGVGASSALEGAKWYIPTYGTVQTTDGDSL